MKRAWVVFGLVLALAGGAGAWQSGTPELAPEARNLIADSSLETAAWTLSGGAQWTASSRGGIGLRSSQRAARISRERDTEKPSATVMVTGLDAGQYLLSAWFRPSMPRVADQNYAAAVDVTWLDEKGTAVGSSTGPFANGIRPLWEYREAMVTAPRGTVAARLTFAFRTTVVGACDLDDVALTREEGSAAAVATTGLPLELSLRPPHVFTDPHEPLELVAHLRGPKGGARDVHLQALLVDSVGNPVATLEATAKLRGDIPADVTLTGSAARLPVGEWLHAEVTATADGCAPATDTCGVLCIPRPTEFMLHPESPFAILLGHPYTQRWVGARWQRPNWNWNVTEMDLSKRYGVIYLAMINEADQALAGTISIDDYAAFVGESVRKFKNFVHYWQLGNEPPLYQKGMPEKYVAVLKAGYEAAKRADPTCKVAMAGITALDVDPEMIAKALDAGAAKYCDLIDLHLYVPVPQMDALLTKVQADMKARGVNKPIILTEVTANLGSAIPERDKAGHIYKRYAVALSHGVAQLYWFVMRWYGNHDFDYCGLLDARNDSPQPAAAAYWNLSQELEGAKFVRREVDPQGLWQFEFRRGDREIFVVWTAADVPQPLTCRIGSGAARLIDVAGRVRSVEPQNGALTVTVTGEPIVIDAPAAPSANSPMAPRNRSIVATPPILRIARGSQATVKLSLGDASAPVSSDRSVRIDAPHGVSVRAGAGGSYGVFVGADAVLGDAVITASCRGGLLRIPLTVTEPLECSIAPVPGDPHPAVAVTLKNLSAQPCGGTVNVRSAVCTGVRPDSFSVGFRDLDPEQSETIRIPLHGTADPLAEYPFDVVVTIPSAVAGGQPVVSRLATTLIFTSAPAFTTPPRIDGNLDDWGGDFPIRIGLDTGERSDPKDGPPTSPDDLSARAAVRWDAQNFYLAVRIRDDIHRNTQQDGALWDGDSIQFGFTARPATSGAAASEWGAALTQTGPEAWCWRNLPGQPTGRMNFPLAVVRTKGETCYEMAIPWKLLPGIRPADGTWFGFGLLLNEMDTANRGYYGWHAGIGGDKDPSRYGQVTLIGR